MTKNQFNLVLENNVHYKYLIDVDVRTRLSSRSNLDLSKCELCGENNLSVIWTPDPKVEILQEEQIHYFLCGHCEFNLIQDVNCGILR